MTLLHLTSFEAHDGVYGAASLGLIAAPPGSPLDCNVGSSGNFGSPGASYLAANRPGSQGTTCVRITYGSSGGNTGYFSLHASIWEFPASVTYRARFWVRFSALPTGTNKGLFYALPKYNRLGIAIDINGQLSAYSNFFGNPPTLLGGPSAGTALTTATWYKCDIEWDVDSTSHCTDIRASIDGASYLSITGLSIATGVDEWNIGWAPVQENLSTVGLPASSTVDFDDYTLRHSGGTFNTTAPDDNEELYFLLPTSDSSLGQWTGGGGGTTSIFVGIDNTPPTGAATATAATQVKNASKTTDTGYVANVDTSVITSGSTVLGLDARIYTGSPQTKTQMTITASEVQSGATSGNVGVQLAAQGAWPTNWTMNAIHNDLSLALPAQFQIKMVKGVASTAELDVCGFPLYVLTLPPVPIVQPVTPLVVSQAIHASSW